MLGAENIAVNLLKNDKGFAVQPISPNKNAKLFFSGFAVVSQLITFKGPHQQNVLKHNSSHILSRPNNKENTV